MENEMGSENGDGEKVIPTLPRPTNISNYDNTINIFEISVRSGVSLMLS